MRSTEGIRKFWDTELHQPQQADKFVAYEARVETEKHGQKQPGSKAIEELRPGEENQYEYSESGQRKFGTREQQRALSQDKLHKRIRLVHSSFD